MAAALDYAQLDGEDIVARFRRDGSVDIRLPERHVAASVQLIDICRWVQQKRGTWPGLFWIARFLGRGFAVIVRIGLFHSQLVELYSLLVVQEPECVRIREENDDHIFRFTQREGLGPG